MFGSSFARLAMLHLEYTPEDDSEMHGARPTRSGAAKGARSGSHALVAGTAVLAVLALRWSKDAPVALNAVTAGIAGLALLWSLRNT
jgi:hypothetical protein